MAETTAVVLGVLISFGIAIAVRLVTNRITLPYTVVLVAIGFLFTLADPQTYVGLDFTLDPLFTHDVILFVFLPAIVFLLNTVLFIAIGLQVSSEQILGVGQLVLVALVLLLAVRAGVVYGLTTLLNRVIKDPISLSYQHVMVWGGMHGVIPVALALSLGPTVPFRDQLQTMVFGVVVASMIVQGLLMPRVLRTTGVSESCRTSST